MTKYGYGTGRITGSNASKVSRDPKTGQWGKRSASSTGFSKLKASGGSFKSVRRES
jgi:hypothetical protein